MGQYTDMKLKILETLDRFLLKLTSFKMADGENEETENINYKKKNDCSSPASRSMLTAIIKKAAVLPTKLYINPPKGYPTVIFINITSVRYHSMKKI